MASKQRRHTIAISILASLTLALVFTGSAAAGGRPFTTSLVGANEVPVSGDPDATGTARLWINPGQGTVCWSITVQNIDPITAAHIHVAPAGSPGPVVVPLTPYSGGCTSVTRALAQAIIRDPAAYYVNVHNATYPAGAARGQLSRRP
jgi:hypothetical protein